MPSTRFPLAYMAVVIMLLFPAAVVTAQQSQTPTASREPIPESVKEAEAEIQTQFKRFGAGFRGGFALDPELLTVGAHATLGPFFGHGIAFRPNAEFGFGELTTMFAINLEAVYYLPISRQGDKQRFYFGAGPGFNFLSRGLAENQVDDDSIDRWDDFDFDVGLNILGGVEWRNGAFAELKASAYGGPTIRFLVGYTF